MRMIKLSIHSIQYEQVEYTPLLKESIIRMGLSFPIKVSENEKGYSCEDGHKRLSVIQDLLEQYPQLEMVNVIVINNGNNRSNDCWRGRNHH